MVFQTVLMPVFDNNLRNKTSLKSTKNTIFVEAGPNVEELMSDMRQFLANAWKEDTGNPITMMKVCFFEQTQDFLMKM